ncbi:phage tail tape measure protein [Clostridium cochlearium]|uniref:Phage protein, tail length tape measure protein n=1 Tax=Clostridium cochlearium TaxID=1494 RepID=A0A2X2VRJ0_CLOCO|nr:phage tail tape measure protein [Clostridium cochlearium]SQB33652.1 phage protein, tail length tape measure protein [Clostridium cochlearium]
MAVNVGTAIAYLQLDKSGFKNSLHSAGQDLKNFATGTGGAEDKIKSLGSALTSTGKAMAKPSIAAGGFLAMATRTAMGFEEQMSKVKAISGATDGEMQKLEKTAREWGAKTKFSAKESAEAMEFMGMAGWKAQEMTDGLPGILNLAAASGEELGTTSDIVTDALTAFGLQAKDSAHFADILAAASTNSNTNVSMLGESFKYVAPVAGALGISAKDTSFALGLMANSGIKGSAAGTALRASLVNLAKPTKQMRKAMDELGVSLVDSKGEVKSGKVLFDELRQKFSKLSDAQKSQYAATIFGKEAMSGMLAIINASDKDYNKLYSNLNNASGSAEKMANTMQNNLKGAITNLKSAFEELQISLAKAVIPMLSKVVKFVTKIVNAFNALPQPVKSAIGIIVGAIALLSPVFLILGKLVKTVSTVVGAFGKLKTAAGVFKALPALITPHTAIVVGAILAIGLIVYEVIKHWDQLVAAGKKFGETIKKIFTGIGDTIKWVIGGWKLLIGGFINWGKEKLKNIKDGFIGGINKVKGLFKGKGKELGKGVKEGFESELEIHSPSRVFAEYGRYISLGLMNGMKEENEKLKYRVKQLGDTVKNTFKESLGIHSPSRVFKSYGDFLMQGLNDGINESSNLPIEQVQNLTKKMLSDINNLDYATYIRAKTSEKLELGSWATDKLKLNGVKTFRQRDSEFKEMQKIAKYYNKLQEIYTMTRLIANTSKSGWLIIGRGWELLIKKVTGYNIKINDTAIAFNGFVKKTILGLGDLISKVGEFFNDLGSKFKSVFKDIKKEFGNFTNDIGNALKQFGNGIIPKAIETGKNIAGGLVTGIKKVGSVVGKASMGLAEGILNVIDLFFDINSPSRVMAKRGQYIGEGLAIGIGKSSNLVKSASDKLANLANITELNGLALSGASGGYSNIGNSKQLNFNPVINMNVTVADTGSKGTEQLTQEVNSMGQVALKNGLVDLFMKDAIRN